MMKAYAIKVGKVTAEGRFKEYETIAYVDTKEKVEMKKEAFWNEHQIEYWLSYETENKGIKFYVEEITIE